jgi:hypothetical protein
MRRLVIVLAALAGVAAVVRRRRRPAERVTVGYEDGSALTFASGTPKGDRLLDLARPALRA